MHKFFCRFLSVVLCLLVVSLASVSSSSLSAEEAYLPPEQAFRFSARIAQPGTIEVRYQIAPGYYLYRERFSFSANGASLGVPVIPPGQIKFDQTFAKDVESYRREVLITIPFQADGAFTLNAVSQGCADRGLCYSPMDSSARLSTGGSGLNSAIEAVRNTLPSEPDAAVNTETELGRIEASLASGRLLLILPLFFLLGLGLSFTPCVLPMVPILSFIIVGDGQRPSRRRGFVLSLTYALGMAIVYTAMGIAAGLIGEGLAARLQSPWVLGSFAALMAVLSLSMFGVYQLQVPAAVQTYFSRLSERQRGGKLFGVFVMGALSALIVGPCVAAPLAGALVYISQTRDVVIGGSALFAMAVGMSVPLLLVGLSAGTLLPRAGTWMDAVKPFFGVLMLALALWMVASLLPGWLLMAGWGLLALAYGVFLLRSKQWGTVPKLVGALFLLLGAVQITGLATGGRDALMPLSHLWTQRVAKPQFMRIKTIDDVNAAIGLAGGRTVMLDFYADWCVSCIEMEKLTFTDKAVAESLANMVLIQADVTANDAADKALLKHFGLFGPPAILFFNASGTEQRAARVIGFQSPERFLRSIKRVSER